MMLESIQPAREHLFEQYRHLVYDNSEEDIPMAHRFIASWIEHPAAPLETVLVVYDHDAGYRRFLAANPKSALALREVCLEPWELEALPRMPESLRDLERALVHDVDDACPDTTPGTAVDARGCVKPERVVIRSAYFGSNSSSPTAKVYEVLRQVADAMQADPRMRLEVEGHSDVSGRTGRNLALSQRRAEVVRRLLIGFGVAPERLTARGYGESRPVNDNDTLEKRAYNRRVEFRRLDAGAP
jgi:outer membrane protein OmpA-like peptidoglycan-associated protein